LRPASAFFPVRTLWTLALNSAITAPPTYDAGRAFFSIEGNQLVAYDVASGKQLWLITSPHDFSPAAGDGLLFVASEEAARLRSRRVEPRRGAKRQG